MENPEAHVPSLSAASKVFAASESMNQILLEQLDPAIWTQIPPGKVRPVAAIFTHLHNVRCKWIRLTAPHLRVPPQLHRAHCSREAARVGLAASAHSCTEMLEESIGLRAGRIKMFHRDSWAPAWPVGLEMVSYMVSHEAHHRGQVCLLAHQLGHPLSAKVTSDLWNWNKLWKDLGYSRGPGN